ncbi:MAG TPA: methyltransferase domain-containing protein [Bryobacteraceae bacterium]|nr:methyltransferase domain-containing protein [Bryobacteraceae bacterium]
MRTGSAIRITAVVMVGILWTGQPGAGQTASRAENERRIASLPDDQRAFERFRFWTSGLPQSELKTAGLTPEATQAALLSKYAAWLAEGGFSAAEVAEQVALVKKRGPAEDAEFWNKYLVSDRRDWVNWQPNAFLVEMVKGRKPGRALDVSMGQGRNTIWLAQQGWDTTGFDPADQAVAEARATALRLGLTIHTEITTDEQFDFGENQWDLVVLSYAGCSQLARQVEKALKPGGLLVEEAFHTDALKTMKIGGSLCGPGELPYAFQGLRVLRYEEPVAKPDFAPRPARVVRFAAEKPIE